MHQQVGRRRGLDGGGAGPGVAGEDDPAPGTRRADAPGRTDRRAVVKRHGLAVLEHARTAARRARPAARAASRSNRPGRCSSTQRVAEAGHAVAGGERLDPLAVRSIALARLQLDQLDRVRSAGRSTGRTRAISAVQPARAGDPQRRLAVAQRERLQHPRQAQHVVGVEVGEQHQVDVRPARRAERSSCRWVPSRAVDQDPLAAAPDERRRRAPRRAVGTAPAVPRKSTSRSIAGSYWQRGRGAEPAQAMRVGHSRPAGA